MKLIIFMAVLLSVIALGCGNGAVQQKTAGQIISNSWEAENELDQKDTWKPLAPPVIITKTDTGDIVALFVTECIAKPGYYNDPETGEPIELYGVPVEVRIKVDENVASPSVSTITTTPYYETRSFLASLRNVMPGTHTVIAEWRSADTGAKVRNRTLTVWETVGAP